MVSSSPAVPAVSPLSFRMLRRGLFAVVLLVAVLVAIAGRPPAERPTPAPTGGFITLSATTTNGSHHS